MSQSNKNLVFVYGTLRRSGFYNHLLKDSEFLGQALSCRKFGMFVNEYPFVTPFVEHTEIVGEVYEVDVSALQALDRLEGHPEHYRRCQTRFVLANSKEIEAFIYLYPGQERDMLLIGPEVLNGDYINPRYS